MSTSRLTFLYPHLFRGARLSESAAQTTRASPACRPGNLAAALPAFAPSPPPRRTSTFAKRHGKAVEPLPLHAVPKAPPPATSAAGTELGAKEPHSKKEKSPRNAEATEKTKQSIAASEAVGKGAEEEVEKVVEEKKRLAPPETTSDGGGRGRGLDQAQADAQAKDAPAACELAPGPKPKSGEPPGTSGPMDAILHMGPPASSSPPPPASSGSGAAESDESPHRAPPHLSPRPYVHHFDSYSLVKQLEAGGWTRAQAITAMKAVRGLLAENLDMAQAGLVSKSDVENEAYLFRAACSELSTEVRNNRRVADEGMRQQRTHLQHEVDILTQKLNQELLTLSDNVKGIFNDRRMAVREEQTAAESVIQQLHYKISVMLNSDTKSEIESVRWVLIRRSVLGIIFMAVLTLGSLRYASYRSHERQKQEFARVAREAGQRREIQHHDGKRDHTAAPDAAEILAAS